MELTQRHIAEDLHRRSCPTQALFDWLNVVFWATFKENSPYKKDWVAGILFLICCFACCCDDAGINIRTTPSACLTLQMTGN